MSEASMSKEDADHIFGQSSAWRSMDTAPKDGTQFLATTVWIIVPNHDKPEVNIIEWDPEVGQWYSDNGGWIDEETIKVKSWMPLPEPDTEGEVWD